MRSEEKPTALIAADSIARPSRRRQLLQLVRKSAAQISRYEASSSSWLNDTKIPARVHEAHQVKQAVVIALLAGGDGHIPQRIDERFGVGSVRCGQAADGCGGHHARRVARGERLAIECVAVNEFVDALTNEKFLDARAENGLAIVLVPPGI